MIWLFVLYGDMLVHSLSRSVNLLTKRTGIASDSDVLMKLFDVDEKPVPSYEEFIADAALKSLAAMNGAEVKF